MEKVNFAGGEPFIVKRGAYLGELVQFCKQDLQLPSVTVVSNGSLITEKWFEKYGEYFLLSWTFFSRRNPFSLHSSKCIVWPWNEFQMVTKLFKPSVVLEMKRKLRIAQSKNRQCIISTHESLTIQWLPLDTR